MIPDGLHNQKEDVTVFTCSLKFISNEEMQGEKLKNQDKYFFYNIINNKKDKNLERGS